MHVGVGLTLDYITMYVGVDLTLDYMAMHVGVDLTLHYMAMHVGVGLTLEHMAMHVDVGLTLDYIGYACEVWNPDIGLCGYACTWLCLCFSTLTSLSTNLCYVKHTTGMNTCGQFVIEGQRQ